MEIADENIDYLRVRIAEKLGWTGLEYSAYGILVGHPPGKKNILAVPSYTRDIKAAWEIVQHLMAHGFNVKVENVLLRGDLRTYVVELERPGEHIGPVENAQAPIAICAAFLKSCQKEVKICAFPGRHPGSP